MLSSSEDIDIQCNDISSSLVNSEYQNTFPLSYDIILYVISFFEETNNSNSNSSITIKSLWNTKDNNNSKSNLLSINKQFYSYKSLTFMYKLNQKSSIDYYNNDNGIRKNIIMKDSIKQLSLNLVYCNDITNLNALNDVSMYKLDLKWCNKLKDVNGLKFKNVHTLDLSYCTNIEDISCLGNINCLNLSHTNVIDVSSLYNVYDLNLSYTNVTDVNGLGQGLSAITNLKLVGCRRIIDVSMLGNVSILDIRGCWRIKNIHKLTNKKLIYNFHENDNDSNSNNSNNENTDDEFN